MQQYRFRAETRADVEILMDRLPNAFYEIYQLDAKLPDVQVDITCAFHIEEVKAVMNGVPDGQLMARTIAPRTKYVDTFKHRNHFSSN